MMLQKSSPRFQGGWFERLEARRMLSASALPRPDHVVVVIEEDHSYQQILGTPENPPGVALPVLPSPLTQTTYMRGLAGNGASFTNAYSIGHRNAETYQAIFSGMTSKEALYPGPNTWSSANLGSELIAAGLTFGGYSESLPYTGYSGGDVGLYKHDHNSWASFTNIPAADKMPFTKFPTDFSKLPTVSYVVPNLDDNMHSGQPSQADHWLENNLDDYAEWATAHNSLLIVTWDESHAPTDQIPTIIFGAHVDTGKYSQTINQFNVLRTIEDMYGLARTGQAATAAPINDVFVPDPAPRPHPPSDVRHPPKHRFPNPSGMTRALTGSKVGLPIHHPAIKSKL